MAAFVSKLGRYYRTLRHLRISQMTGQVAVRVRQKTCDPATYLADKAAADCWLISHEPIDVQIPMPAVSQCRKDLALGTFTFINQKQSLGYPVDWRAMGMPRLWSYNLHYFDWLWSLLGEDLVSDEDWNVSKKLILGWIEHHQPSRSAGGWEPYPISLRLMNWSLLVAGKHKQRLKEDADFESRFLDSIAKQVAWLEKNVETHIQANHLLENLVAFACVGAIYGGKEAKRIEVKFRSKLECELEEQFLGDGLHYERSPMYHLRMLWLLEVLLCVSEPDAKLVEYVEGMLNKGKVALGRLRHPDGEIALLNDAAIGIYPDAWKAGVSQTGAWELPESGYYGFRDEHGHYLVVDAAAVGPDYQPGHAHADYLSFELSLNGERVISDTGIGTYDAGERRSYDRSTAAHSTVEIGSADSAEVWGGFRVGRRVTPKVQKWRGDEQSMLLKVSHDGYSHLSCKAKHTRTFLWESGSLEIQDKIILGSEESVVSRLHFAAECSISLDCNVVHVLVNGNSYQIELEGDFEASLEVHPSCIQFGLDENRSVLVMKNRLAAGVHRWALRIKF